MNKKNHSLLYISTVSRDLDVSSIKSILKHAVESNMRSHISGFLLFRNNNFIQLLEGDEQVVTSTYQRIITDSRHNNIIVLLREQISQRNFYGYQSAFKSFDNIADFDKFIAYIDLMGSFDKAEQSQSLKVIQGIIKNM